MSRAVIAWLLFPRTAYHDAIQHSRWYSRLWMLSLISIISTIPMPWSIEGLFRSALAQSLHDQPPIFATIGLLYDPATTIDVCIAIVVSQRSNNSRIGLLVVCIGANSISASFVALCSLDFFFLLQSHTSSHLFTADYSIPDLLLHLPPLCSSHSRPQGCRSSSHSSILLRSSSGSTSS